MILEITGRTKNHLIYDENLKRFFHKETLSKFLKLKERALRENVDLYVLSSFRSFEDQLNIWNKKCLGEKTLYDSDGIALDFHQLNEEEVVFAILRWSALPGTSRHHWGTDFDVVDKNTWPSDYHVELVPSEFSEGSMFYKMKCFFDEIIENEDGLGFFRPYDIDQNGVAPEMWHYSDIKIAQNYYESFTFSDFKFFLNSQDSKSFLNLDIVKENAEFIFENYVRNISLSTNL